MSQEKQIVKVYSGKPGCMCGCRGKWTYTNYGAENHNPGYTPNINERTVKMISNLVLNDPARKTQDRVVYVESPGRIRAVYLG